MAADQESGWLLFLTPCMELFLQPSVLRNNGDAPYGLNLNLPENPSLPSSSLSSDSYSSVANLSISVSPIPSQKLFVT